jgi:protein TonB
MVALLLALFVNVGLFQVVFALNRTSPPETVVLPARRTVRVLNVPKQPERTQEQPTQAKVEPAQQTSPAKATPLLPELELAATSLSHATLPGPTTAKVGAPGVKPAKAVARPASPASVLSEVELDRPLLSLSSPEVVFPVVAKRRGIEGDVKLELFVGPDGHVVRVRPLSGPSVLVAAAEASARRTVFSKPTAGGRPVSVLKPKVYAFRLE